MSCSQNYHEPIHQQNIDSDSLFDQEIEWKISKMIEIKNAVEEIVDSVQDSEFIFGKTSKTVFDFDLTNLESKDVQKNLLKCVVSLIASKPKEIDTGLFEILLATAYNKQQIEFFKKLVTHLMQICIFNQFSLNIYCKKSRTLVKVGNCLLPFASLFNHSCDPNIIWTSSPSKFTFIAAKPIEAGEQLFISYR